MLINGKWKYPGLDFAVRVDFIIFIFSEWLTPTPRNYSSNEQDQED